jgi:hypothetical protein
VIPRSLLPAIKRALANNPKDRFSTNQAFLSALLGTDSGAVFLGVIQPLEWITTLSTGATDSRPKPAPDAFVRELVALAQQRTEMPDCSGNVRVMKDGRMAMRFPLKWTPGLDELKTKAFCDKFRYAAIPMVKDTVLLKPRASVSKSNCVELVVRWPVLCTAHVAEVFVTGRAMIGFDQNAASELVSAMLDQFRKTVQNMTNHRGYPRVGFDTRVVAYAVDDDLRVSTPLDLTCVDISASGVLLAHKNPVEFTHAFMQFPQHPTTQDGAVLAILKRMQQIPATMTYLSGWNFAHARVHKS